MILDVRFKTITSSLCHPPNPVQWGNAPRGCGYNQYSLIVIVSMPMSAAFIFIKTSIKGIFFLFFVIIIVV